MKKFYSIFMMFVLMVATLGFAACSSDDDNNSNGQGENGTASTGDFIEISLLGKKYHHNTKPINYAQIDHFGEDAHGATLTSTYSMEDDWGTEAFEFYYGLIHFSDKSKLLATTTGAYPCQIVSILDDVYQNMTFVPELYIDDNSYDLVSGTHQVTSIKSVDGKVQVEGKFSAVFEYEGDNVNVNGSYRMTIP